MVVTTTSETTDGPTAAAAQGRLRPIDPIRDLGAIAGLIEAAFARDMDERGRAAMREMRWMARLSPLVWWLSQADPAFRDTLNGFVWEAPASQGKGMRQAQVVGNVSLNRAPGNPQRAIICNVVVQEAYRGQGIGRKLTETAVAEARATGAQGAVLQVHQDNRTALRLYTDLGFQQASGETDLRLEAGHSVAILDAPGYRFRAWQPQDGQAVYQIARRVTPTILQWFRPLKATAYRPGWWERLVQSAADLLAGRRVYRLVALQEDRLVALMTVSAAFRSGEHTLALLIHPDHFGHLEAALVSRALHMLEAIPPKPVKVTVDKDHQALLKVLQDYGFQAQRTLLTMRLDFDG